MNRRISIWLLYCSFFLAANTCFGANVLWNTFEINDFSSWHQGAWVLGSGLPYAPSVGFYGDGAVWVEGGFNADGGGAYWVHSVLGGGLSPFCEYAGRRPLADAGDTGKPVVAGEGVSGGHEYLAIIGYTSNIFDPTASIETYYGWVELEGNTVIASAITAVGPLRIGTGDVIPEPSGGLLFLLGGAALVLRRRRRTHVGAFLISTDNGPGR